MNKKHVIIFLILVLAVGVASGFFIAKKYANKKCVLSNFKYISEDLTCNSTPVVSKKSYTSFKNKLDSKVQEKIDENKIKTAAVYFRDLRQGPTFGIREYDKYAPASLLKLPILLTYLSLEDNIPELSQVRLYYKDSGYPTEQYYPPKKTLQENVPYSIEELLDYMIVYSDNRAYYVLLDYLVEISPNKDLLQETYFDLGLIDPQTPADNTITVKSYSAIFTQIFFGSFLDKNGMSEHTLSLLAQSDYDVGIKAGVPKDVEVAHKFGERSGFEGDLKQLHDCGIIYYPENPYLLCVMTQGQNFDDLSATIGMISKMVYEEFDSRKN